MAIGSDVAGIVRRIVDQIDGSAIARRIRKLRVELDPAERAWDYGAANDLVICCTALEHPESIPLQLYWDSSDAKPKYGEPASPVTYGCGDSLTSTCTTAPWRSGKLSSIPSFHTFRRYATSSSIAISSE